MAIYPITSKSDLQSILSDSLVLSLFLPVPICVFFISKDRSKPSNGITLVISINKKIANAVIRNKIKRRLRVIMNDISNMGFSFQCMVKVTNIEFSNILFSLLKEKIFELIYSVKK